MHYALGMNVTCALKETGTRGNEEPKCYLAPLFLLRNYM